MKEYLIEQYKKLGISEEVYRFGEKVEENLKDRLEKSTNVLNIIK